MNIMLFIKNFNSKKLQLIITKDQLQKPLKDIIKPQLKQKELKMNPKNCNKKSKKIQLKLKKLNMQLKNILINMKMC